MENLAISLGLPKWNVEEELGYKPITSFWQDFSIAERFGGKAVRLLRILASNKGGTLRERESGRLAALLVRKLKKN